MKKLITALAVCVLTLPTANAYAEQKKKSDKPDEVIVTVDKKTGSFEVTVIVHKKK